MSVTLNPEVEAKVRQMVEEGLYADADTVVQKAIELLDERDRKLKWLQSAIAASDEQITRGEGIPYTPELLEEIDREVDDRFQRGDIPHPDICP
jgi:antitoxin ParD1/3/4